MSLANKVAVVTGASSGIGAAIAIKFAKEGAKIVIVGRNEGKLKNVSEICEQSGVKPLTIIGDVSKDADAKRIIAETLKYFNRLDILVNNAGIAEGASILEDKAMAIYDKVMNTNLRAAVHLTHLAAKHLVDTKGNIINISSIAAHAVLSKTIFSYSASKAGLDHFTRCIAYDLGPKGVRVNAINPGPVKTDIIVNSTTHQAIQDRAWDIWKNATILDRVADAEEIGDLAAFLASDKARSITGSTIVSDNGAVILGPWDKSKL